MEVQVTITEICPVENIVSKSTGKEYHKYKFVGKTQGAYPKEICFETLGEDKMAQFNLVAGQNYIVSFDIESRRWNDKFFTSVNAWKVVPDNAQVQAQQPVVQQPTYQQPTYQQQSYQQPPYGYPQVAQSAPAPTQMPQTGDDPLPF